MNCVERIIYKLSREKNRQKLATINTNWTYDEMGRLTGETLASTLSNTSYTTTYTYDLESDMLTANHTGPGDGATGTTTFTYDPDNQLTSQVSTVSGTTTFTYDNNGSQLTATNGSNVTSYTYDVRNKMIGEAVNGTTIAELVYDDAGDRVQETTGGTTYFYLTDTANPTGFDQPIEVWTSTTGTRSTATLNTSYIIGDRVLAQADSAGNVTYLLVDGHGSTRLLVSAAVAVTGTINYDAFGGEVSTSGSTNTIFRFAGDGPTDLATGIRMPGDGTRDIEEGQADFIERDIPGPWDDNWNPISLNAEVYGDGDPVNGDDPSGHYDYNTGLAAQAFAEADADIGEDVIAGVALNDYFTEGQRDQSYAAESSSTLASASASNYFNSTPQTTMQAFWQGAWAGVLNLADDFTFQQISSLHNYRNSYWQQTGLAGTSTETWSNLFAWTAVGAFDLAAVTSAFEMGGVGGPPTDQPLPPGWNENWEWRYPEGEGPSSPRWFDEDGGEWRYHGVDPWHDDPHWDYNPWDEWNSQWQNVPIEEA